MERVFNFAAGPATMSLEVLQSISLPTNPLKMKQNIRNDGYIVLTSIKNKPSNAVFF